MNHADGVTFGSVLAGPIVAGIAGIVSGAGWFSIILVPVGFVGGVLTGLFVHRTAYAILQYGMAYEGKWTNLPATVVYLFLPMLLSGSGLAATWFACLWLGARMA